jgi:ankyrin repeat protein
MFARFITFFIWLMIPLFSSAMSLQTKLFEAIESYDLEEVKDLIRLSVNVNATNETGQTALHLAIDLVLNAWTN